MTQESCNAKEAVSFAIQSVPALKDVPSDQLSASVLSGGITNQLFKITRKETGKSVVVRVFGKETDRIISRDAEFFWQSLFLKTYARSKTMLVYEFLDGYRPIEYPEMCALGAKIAPVMAQAHVLATSASIFQLPYAAERLHTDVVLDEWTPLVLNVEEIKRNVKPDSYVKYEALNWQATLEKERDWLKAVIARHRRHLPVAVCHNDLLNGNVMINEDTGDLKFIDFEYARLNYTFFDIANHFNEYCGFDCDYDTYYPTADQERAFVRSYLEEGRRATKNPTPVSSEEVETASQYVSFFTLVSHYAWAVWSLVQEQHSEIDFGYIDYAHKRWAKYLQVKASFPYPTIF